MGAPDPTRPVVLEIKAATSVGALAAGAEPTGDPLAFTIIGGVTGLLDEVGDIVEPGAYAETLTKRRPKIIKDHDWARRLGRSVQTKELLPGDPGLPTEISPGNPWPAEAGALISEVRLFDTREGRDAAERWREDPAQQFSIGYIAERAVKGSGAVKRRLKKVALWEISDVLWGAMPSAGMMPTALATKMMTPDIGDGDLLVDDEVAETKAAADADDQPEAVAEAETEPVDEDDAEVVTLHAALEGIDWLEVDAAADEVSDPALLVETKGTLPPALAAYQFGKGGKGGPDKGSSSGGGSSADITDAASLTAAIKALGKAKDKGAERKRIIARAKALGLTAKLPPWMGEGKGAAVADTLATCPACNTDVVYDDGWLALDGSVDHDDGTTHNDYIDPPLDVKAGGRFAEAVHPRGKDGKWIPKVGDRVRIQNSGRHNDKIVEVQQVQDNGTVLANHPDGGGTQVALESPQYARVADKPHADVALMDRAEKLEREANKARDKGDRKEETRIHTELRKVMGDALDRGLVGNDGNWTRNALAKRQKTATKAGVPMVADTPSEVAAVTRLKEWYEKGGGAAKIRWGTEGDWQRCVDIAGKHMTPERAKGWCQLRHKGATGFYAGHAPGEQHKALDMPTTTSNADGTITFTMTDPGNFTWSPTTNTWTTNTTNTKAADPEGMIGVKVSQPGDDDYLVPDDENPPAGYEAVDDNQAPDGFEPVDEPVTIRAERKDLDLPWMAGSLEERGALLRKALDVTLPEAHVEATYLDHAIVSTVDPEGDATWLVPYGVDDDGAVQMGDPEEVRLVVVAEDGTETDVEAYGDESPADLDHVAAGAEIAVKAFATAITALTPDGLETKSGRVLSSANESRLRAAVEHLLGVLKAAGIGVEPDGPAANAAATQPVSDTTSRPDMATKVNPADLHATLASIHASLAEAD